MAMFDRHILCAVTRGGRYVMFTYEGLGTGVQDFI